MKKFQEFITTNFTWIVAAYVLLQLLLLFKFPLPYSSDSRYLYGLAQQCINAGKFYPLPEHLYHDYLVAPVFINLLVILLKLWNSQYIIALFNIALNTAQIFLLFTITRKIFTRNIAVISCVLYMLYLNNLGMVLMNFNDLLFNVLISAALLLFMRETLTGMVLSGLLTGLAVGVRPVAWAFLLAVIVITLWEWKQKRASNRPLFSMLIGTALTILMIGFIIKAGTGTFVYTSNFSGLNIIIGANDDALGGFQPKVFDKGKSGYIGNIESLTHEQREEFWRQKAFTWIQEHPVRWALLMPLKLIRMYITDDYNVSRLFFEQYSIYHVYRGIRYGEPMPAADRGYPAAYIVTWAVVQLLHHLFFFWIVWTSIKALIKTRHKVLPNKFIRIILIYCMVGIAMTLLAYGEARYKYPYLLTHFIFTALYLNSDEL
ncbi:MAG: glycosyltransferase family 39 protein [Ignavibacteriales bacterium]|nr:glycosyltransferase family 39 protein [Ignavibacteriales bacterium]